MGKPYSLDLAAGRGRDRGRNVPQSGSQAVWGRHQHGNRKLGEVLGFPIWQRTFIGDTIEYEGNEPPADVGRDEMNGAKPGSCGAD